MTGRCAVGWQVYQLAEASKDTRFEGCDGVVIEGIDWSKCGVARHALWALCCSRDVNDVRPENAPTSRDAMAFE